MVSTSSITTQSLRKIVLRAPAGAKIWCLYVYFFCLTRSEAGALFRSRNAYFEHVLCRLYCIYGSILMWFSPFFSEGSAFQSQYMVLIFVTNSEKWRSKIAESPKIGGKVCTHHIAEV